MKYPGVYWRLKYEDNKLINVIYSDRSQDAFLNMMTYRFNSDEGYGDINDLEYRELEYIL